MCILYVVPCARKVKQAVTSKETLCYGCENCARVYPGEVGDWANERQPLVPAHVIGDVIRRYGGVRISDRPSADGLVDEFAAVVQFY